MRRLKTSLLKLPFNCSLSFETSFESLGKLKRERGLLYLIEFGVSQLSSLLLSSLLSFFSFLFYLNYSLDRFLGLMRFGAPTLFRKGNRSADPWLSMKMCWLGKKKVTVVRIKRVEFRENVRAVFPLGTRKTVRIERSAAIKMYWNNRKFLRKNKVQLLENQHGRRFIVLENQ